MPYKDPERKKDQMRHWRAGAIARGYGKWLYRRRKLRFEDAERFRTAIEVSIDALDEGVPSVAREILVEALNASLEAEAALGDFQETTE